MRGVCLYLLVGHALSVAWPTSQKGRSGLVLGSFNHPPWWTTSIYSGAGIDDLDRMDSINNYQFQDLELVNVVTRLKQLNSDAATITPLMPFQHGTRDEFDLFYDWNTFGNLDYGNDQLARQFMVDQDEAGDNFDQIDFDEDWIIHDLKVKNELKVSMERNSGKATLPHLKPFQHGMRKEFYEAMFFYDVRILDDGFNDYKSSFFYQDFMVVDQIYFDKYWIIHNFKMNNELKVSMERDSGKATLPHLKPFQHGMRKGSYDAMFFYDFGILDNGLYNYKSGIFDQNFIMVHKDDNGIIQFGWIIKLVIMEMEMEMDIFICPLLSLWNCLFLVLWFGNCWICFF